MASRSRRRLAAPDVAALVVDSGTDESNTNDGDTGANATDSSESPSSSEDEYFEEASTKTITTCKNC